MKNTGDSSMPLPEPTNVNRRNFLKRTGLAALALTATPALAAEKAKGVSIILEPDDQVASTQSSRWAVSNLQQALTARNVAVRLVPKIAESAPGDICIVVGGIRTPLAQELLAGAKAVVPNRPESLGLVPGKSGKRSVLL